MPPISNEIRIVNELAKLIHDLRREQASDILHHLKTENFEAYLAVLGAFCEGSYAQSSTAKKDEARDIVFKIIVKIGELADKEEGLSPWMEACKEAFRASKKDDEQGSVESKLKDFIIERYGSVYSDASERPEEIAIEMLDKILMPISEPMAFNISMSFMKAISGELSQPLPTEEQRAIAKRTVNGIRGLLTTAYRIHVTGKRMGG